VREQVDPVRDAAVPQVRHRRHAELGAEAGDEMRWADVGGAGERGQVDVGVRQVRVREVPRALDRVIARRPGLGIARVAPARGGGQRGERLRPR
jgi:hypothetical protein